jgi:hypothetical protein
MKTVLIILNYNHAKDTICLVSTLLKNLDKAYQIFIIDNNSADIRELEYFSSQNKAIVINGIPTEIRNEFFNSRIILIKLTENGGYAKGNNVGLRLADKMGYEYAFIINPDVQIIDFSVFDKLINILQKKNNVAIAAPKVLSPIDNKKYTKPFIDIDSSYILYAIFYPISPIFIKIKKKYEVFFLGYNYVFSVIGCFFALNIKLWNDVGYFDENTFLYIEEQIISKKLKLKGYKIVFVPTLNIIHNHIYEKSLSTNQFFIKSKEYYDNNYDKLSPFKKKLLNYSIWYVLVFWGNIKKSLIQLVK